LSTPIEELGYNIYTINISKLDIKGDYGKGIINDVFKIRENKDTKEYDVFYVTKDGENVNNN